MADTPIIDNQEEEEEFTEDLDLMLDWETQDELLALAKAQDEAGWEAYAKDRDPEYLAEQLNQVSIDIVQRMYKRCQAILPPKPLSDPPNRLYDLMQVLFYLDPTPEKMRMQRVVLPAIQAIRWLRSKRVDMLMPEMVKKLQSTFDQYFTPQTQYMTVKYYGSTARDMLRALPNITWPNEQFTKDLEEIFDITREPEEVDDSQFVLRVTNILYYYQVLCYTLVGAAQLNQQPEDAVVDLKTALILAPPILKSLYMRDDQMLKNLVLPEEAIASLTPEEEQFEQIEKEEQAQPTEESTESPILDIG